MGVGGVWAARAAALHRYLPALASQAVKRWAADELHRHLGSGVNTVMRSLVGSMVRLSQSLHASRPDHGSHPTVLGRTDIGSLLHRLTYLASIGRCSPELRVRPVT